MALTDKSKAFAKAKLQGFDNKQAAIQAGYSESTASQKGSALAKDEHVLAYMSQLKKIKETAQVENYDFAPDKTQEQIKQASGLNDPLAFLLGVMNDCAEDVMTRIIAAKAALPYVHGKVGDVGKKESQKNDAEGLSKGSSGTGRFAATQPPRRVN